MAKYTTESWIQRCKDKYGDRFTYEDTVYIDSYHKVKIHCVEHNETFEVDPIAFSRTTSNGNYCPQCKPTNTPLTSKQFLAIADEKYGHKYDLSKINFKTTRDKVILVCPEHGEFQIIARYISCEHYDSLCPKCNKYERGGWDWVKFYTKNKAKGLEPGVFYKLKVTHIETGLEFLKIGITSYCSYQRYNDKVYKDFEFEVLEETFDTNLNTAIMESKWKKENKAYRFHLPADLHFPGRSECYILDVIQLKSKHVKFIREALLDTQQGLCAICKQEPVMPTLDHHHVKKNHGDGLVRGVLCNQCNRMVGIIENNAPRCGINFSNLPDILRYIANYLIKEKQPLIHPSEAPPKIKLKKSSYNKLVKTINKKQKIPKYTGNFTKSLEALFEKYEVEPSFYGEINDSIS